NVEKMLKEHRDKISEADAKEVEAAVEAVKKAIGDGNLEQINAATDKLTSASHKLAEAMYKTQSTSGNGAAGPGAGAGAGTGAQTGEKPKDNVVDAEFVDVEDKK
ncbi:MAG: molecular chaperone DnaK, partial [Acidobacteriaceae bacterium]|nr:molecular chaperone DnaK [Acidobacteriaceae bacterium]